MIGRVDPKWGERPILLVALREHQQVGDAVLLSALRGRGTSWWVLDAMIRVAATPLAATGEIDQLRLRATCSGA